MGVKTVVLVGGMDMHAQGMILEKKPHIIIATPGRLVDHLENTKGFNLRQLKFLVIIFMAYGIILCNNHHIGFNLFYFSFYSKGDGRGRSHLEYGF